MLSAFMIELFGGAGQKSVEQHAKSYEGRNFLLKIDLIEIHSGIRGIDATKSLFVFHPYVAKPFDSPS